MKILVVNCGSSSIKYQLYSMPERHVLAKGQVERIGEEEAAVQFEAGDHSSRQTRPVADHEQGMRLILEALVSSDDHILKDLSEIAAVGHRVVHGAEAFTGSVLIDDEVISSIERCADLAPLHNPANLTGIQAAMHALPDCPHVACFDTAFHASIPQMAYLYALPYEVYKQYGVRRYGFHGTSHRFVAARTAEILGQSPEATNCITVHLGNGCSMTAVRDGKSVDTSMGLTPLEGLVMGTRSGDIDPAILFYLADKGMSVGEMNTLCNKQSGLLGVSGQSNDMRTLGGKGRKRAASGRPWPSRYSAIACANISGRISPCWDAWTRSLLRAGSANMRRMCGQKSVRGWKPWGSLWTDRQTMRCREERPPLAARRAECDCWSYRPMKKESSRPIRLSLCSSGNTSTPISKKTTYVRILTCLRNHDTDHFAQKKSRR